MPFQVSPGVNVTEVDLTTIVPAVSTSVAGIAGVFRWGPVDKQLLISNEDQLAVRYGKPTNLNAETWFTAASFLAHSTALRVSRAFDLTNSDTDLRTLSAVAVAEEDTTTATNTSILTTVTVKNEDHYDSVTFNDAVHFVARYPGAMGNSLKISVCTGAEGYETTLNLGNTVFENNGNGIDQVADFAGFSINVGSSSARIQYNLFGTDINVSNVASTDAAADLAKAEFQVGDVILLGNSTIGYQSMTIATVGNVTALQNESGTDTGESYFDLTFTDTYKLSTNISGLETISKKWEYYDEFSRAPGQTNWFSVYGGNTGVDDDGNYYVNDEMHIIVVDEDGMFSGVPGTVLEKYESVSRATDAKLDTGQTNYYKTIINENSNYVWWANDVDGAASNTGAALEAANTATGLQVYTQSFAGGQDGGTEETATVASILQAWDKMKEADEVNVSLCIAGKSRGGVHGEQIINYLIDNVAEYRKDCIVLGSPHYDDVVNNTGGDIEQDVVEFRNACRSSSYAVLDSGYKYMYDKYNDVYRWIPLNGDVAGLCAATDNNRDPWFSPAGLNRGRIKNIVKLSWNPTRAQRDELYANAVNPVVNFTGEGIILYGDKTLLGRPSAFDRINVRRLFIVLEKSIAIASRSTLFEFNDEFTRSSFVALVEPYLRNVQGRRGITDFLVVCDESNNTPEVVDRNEFIGDIYIKPARSINFIQLNFVAVRTGVEFSEIITNG
jgi:phage tail sheath protein FI